MRQAERTEHIKNVIHRTSSEIYGDSDEDMIARSWRRCVTEYGLDPVNAQPARIIENHQLIEHREQVEDYLRVARAGMEQLFKRVSPLGYVLLLTDSKGVTVDYIGNDQWDRELRHSGLYLGADWREEHAGTCAVGTCIVEQAPITCHQTDHFDSTHIGLTCTASPLFDPTGEFLGVLDISALTSPTEKSSQHLAGHLTKMYSRMIEDANFVRYFGGRWILRLGADWALVDVSGNCMIAFDADGVIVGANSVARSLLSARLDDGSFGQIVGRNLTDVFRGSMDNVWRVASSVTSNEHGVLTTHQNEMLYAVARPPRRAGSSPQIAKVNASSAVHTDCSALENLAGDDSQMQRLIDQSKRLVNKKVNILVHGETGTGKEVVARALHDSSVRASEAFVAVNCASIPESLIESELFGYTAGSFTGGRSKGAQGLIAQSSGGTLFLDEIGDMPLQLQTRLLRVLSEQEVMPLGANKPIPVKLTVIAASHRDLRVLMANGEFREDLYYRLCGAGLRLPPFRDREDKPFIINRILKQEADSMGLDSYSVSSAALTLMLHHPWPGNIRQLRNVVRFAMAVSDEGRIDVCHLPEEFFEQDNPMATNQSANGLQPPELHAMLPTEIHSNPSLPPEGQRLGDTLKRHHWNVTATSKELGICRATVYRQMKRYGIVSPTQL